jgi:hypothetical protein
MCSITELRFVRVLAQAPPVWCLTFLHLRSLLLRPSSEAPPPDLRYAGSSQTYLEPGFAERQPCLSHYEFACTPGCLKLLFEKMSGAIATIGPISSPCFILG